MKALTTALVCLAFVTVAVEAQAQPPDSAAADTSAMRPNWFYYVKGEQLVRVDATPLETRASMGAGDVAAGLLWGGGGKTWMVVPGETSEIRIDEARPRFRVRSEKVVAMMIRLAPLQVKNGQRWVQTNLQRSRDFFRKPVELTLTRLDDGLYEIVPAQALEPGEYGFAVSAAGPVTDFTVVSAKAAK